MQHEDGRSFRFAPTILAAIGLTLAIAGAVTPQQQAPLGGLATRIALPLPDWIVIAAMASLSLASLIFIVIALPRARRRRKKGENEYEIYHEPRKIPPWVVVALLLVATAPAAVLGGAVIWYERHQPYATQGPEGLAAPHGPGMPTAISPNVAAKTTARPASVVTSGLFGTLALLTGFGSLGFVLWLLFADRWVRRMPADFDDPDGRLATAVEDGLEDLRREPDARVAIIRIYQNFERALAGAKMPKPPWQTPMEFMRSVLAKLPLPAPAGQRTDRVVRDCALQPAPGGHGRARGRLACADRDPRQARRGSGGAPCRAIMSAAGPRSPRPMPPS